MSEVTPNQTIDRPSGGHLPPLGVNGARPVGDRLAPIAGVVEPAPPASHPGPNADRPRGVGGFYVAALAATAVSVDTSWRFFAEVLLIDRLWERSLMFLVLEITLVACGWAMRANVRRGDGPGAPRILAWALCGMSAYMAIALSGPVAGLARVALGPALGLVALHLALGIEIRAKRGSLAGTWAKVGVELRERALSLLGLGDDIRSALTRTQDRAAQRAARLATAKRAPWRDSRLARAVRASGATTDPVRRAALVEQVAALRHVTDLRTVDWPSPWVAEHPVQVATPPAAKHATAMPLSTPRHEPLGDAWRLPSTPRHEPLGDAWRLPSTPLHGSLSTPRATPSSTPKDTSAAHAKAAALVAKARAASPVATQKQVAKATGLGERTVQRHWHATDPAGHAGNGGPVPAAALHDTTDQTPVPVSPN